MRVLFFGKWPPIQGGVARESYLFVRALAARGHSVIVLTNASAAPEGLRAAPLPGDDAHCFYGAQDPAIEIRDVYSEATRESIWHIPYATPFLSLLIGEGLIAARETGPDVVVGSYLEPYGLAASIVARACGTPLVLRHAGSDIARLAEQPALRQAYSLCTSATAILSTRSEATTALLRRIGFAEEQIVRMRPGSFPFSRYGDMGRYDLEAHRAIAATTPSYDGMSGIPALNTDPAAGPVVATYGKIGRQKGTFALLNALDDAQRRGQRFRLRMIAAGSRPMLAALRDRLRSSPGLAARTEVLPPIMPWNVPGFLAECDLVAFLEHDFSVAIHGPSIPEEIIASGAVPIIANEQVRRRPYADALVCGTNAIRIDTVGNGAEIAMKLARPLAAPDLLSDMRSRASVLARVAHGRDWGKAGPKPAFANDGMASALDLVAQERFA